MFYGTIHGFGVLGVALAVADVPWLAWRTGRVTIALDIDLEDRRVVEKNSPLYSVT
jgi:hypothetical protein